jgi:hypothetical protein
MDFIDHLQMVTITIAVHTLCNSLQHALSIFCLCVFSSRCLVTASNGGRSAIWVPELSPVVQLPGCNTSDSQELNRRCPHTLTNQLALYFTQLNSIELAPLIVLLTPSRHKQHRKHRSSVPVFTVACAAICADRVENTAF